MASRVLPIERGSASRRRDASLLLASARLRCDDQCVRELWGTFSVRDHCEERPFVADVMLYDRLIVPVPSDSTEWERWQHPDQDWDPARQKRLLDVFRRYEDR